MAGVIVNQAFTFVVPVNNDEVYKNNFLASPLFRDDHSHQIMVKKNYFSAVKAYNEAIDEASNDLIVFAHQDVIFPKSWLNDLENALKYLEENDPSWGVLGCFGMTKDGKEHGYLYCVGNGRILGRPFLRPQPVQTLDEIVLILSKSSKLRFDDFLPGFHFYGTDICMSASAKGKKCYAISAFVLHNSNQMILFPRDFLACYKYTKKRWKDFLPIQTSCIRIERYDINLYWRQMKRFVRTILGEKPRSRYDEPKKIMEKLKNIKIESHDI